MCTGVAVLSNHKRDFSSHTSGAQITRLPRISIEKALEIGARLHSSQTFNIPKKNSLSNPRPQGSCSGVVNQFKQGDSHTALNKKPTPLLPEKWGTVRFLLSL